MPTENCCLVSFDDIVTDSTHSLLSLAHEGRPAGAVIYVKSVTGRNYAKKSMNHGWVKVYCHVMDGCMLLNKSSTLTQWKLQLKREKDKQFYSVVPELWLTLTVEKLKSSQTKLATGACKNWVFFAVDNFPPCKHVTIFPQYRAPVAGQPEPPPFGPCCSCSFFWTRDAFHKFSQSYDMVGLTAGLLVDLDWRF